MQVTVPDPSTFTGNGAGPGLSAQSNVSTRGAAAAWLPDLSLSLALLTLLWCLLLFDGWHKLFRDSDTGWHIRAGESMLAARALPFTDPYSFTRLGAHWMDWEWMADAASGAAHRSAGLPGVAVLFAAAIAICSWLWVRLTWAAGGDFLLACLFALPMLTTVNMHWLARPHVFGWVLLLLWLLWMERPGERVTPRAAIGAIAFGAVWANVHGSFFLAPAIAFLYAAGCLAKPVLWGFETKPALARARWFGLMAAAFAAGTAANPFGLALHAHVFRYLGDAELLARIGEFQSFNFHAEGAGWILLTVALSFAGAVLALGNRRPEHALTIALFVAMALRSARGLPVIALCILPLVNANIAEALGRARGMAPRLRCLVDHCLGYSGRLRTLDRGLSGAALIPMVAIVLAFIAKSPAVAANTGFPADSFPVEAASAVGALPPSMRLLAPDKFGGYLIYRFSGARKVFFDGRSDFFGAEFMKEYLRLMEARPGWREIAARHAFTHALLPKDSALLAALDAAGWRVVHKDGMATLLARPE